MNATSKFAHSFRPGVIAGLLLLLALLAGCSSNGNIESKGRGRGDQAVPVTVATAQHKSMPVQITSIGTIEAFSTVMIKSQVNGQIVGMHFTEGQDVRKGDLLFTIDARPFQADLDKQVANLAKDEAALANARAQAKRWEELKNQGVAAKEQADTIITNAQTMEATVNADHAAVEASRVQLQYTKIYAPISGRTGNVSVKVGNRVNANGTAPLVTINQITPIFATFNVPEQSLSDIKRYMASGKLTVTAQPQGQSPVQGKLTFVDNAVDSTTGTIKLKATFENTNRLLWPGQFITAVLTLATQHDATVVPSQAVLNGQQGTYVYVAKKDNTVESRNVVVERTNGLESIISSGVQPGEAIIADGQLRLVPGARIEVKSAYVPPSTAPMPPGSATDPTSVAARDVPLANVPPAINADTHSAAPPNPNSGNAPAPARPRNNSSKQQEAER
jgi:membrane fusion protein, multidrug efflux system